MFCTYVVATLFKNSQAIFPRELSHYSLPGLKWAGLLVWCRTYIHTIRLRWWYNSDWIPVHLFLSLSTWVTAIDKMHFPERPRYQSINSDYELSNTSYQKSGIEYQQRPSDQIVPRSAERIAWLPWLLLTFMACFFYFVSMFYSVQLMSDYEDSPLRFELIQWSIFLVPTMILAFFLVTPFPSSLRQARATWSKNKPPPSYLPTINILNALFCLIAVALYLNLSAFPDYRNSRWTTDIQYQERLPIPSLAFIFKNDRSQDNHVYYVNSSDAIRYWGKDWIQPCEIWNVSDSNPSVNCSNAMEWTKIAGYTAYTFNSKKLSLEQRRTINDLQSGIYLRQYLAYNTSISPYPSTLYQGAIVYDPDITNLSQALECGLLSMPNLYAFGTNVINMHLTQMQDQADMFSVPSGKESCKGARTAIFPKSETLYNIWTWTTNSRSAANIAYCDVAKNYTGPCISTTVLSYDSQMIQSVKSSPGTSRLNVWLNAGSIIGGVQFFFWFLTIFRN